MFQGTRHFAAPMPIERASRQLTPVCRLCVSYFSANPSMKAEAVQIRRNSALFRKLERTLKDYKPCAKTRPDRVPSTQSPGSAAALTRAELREPRSGW